MNSVFFENVKYDDVRKLSKLHFNSESRPRPLYPTVNLCSLIPPLGLILSIVDLHYVNDLHGFKFTLSWNYWNTLGFLENI